MKFEWLVFDLDGTLTDPLLGIHRCMNYALTSFDYPPRSTDEIAAFIGPPLEAAIAEFTGSNDETHIKELIKRYRERYGELGFAENTVYDGIPQMLAGFKQQGIAMGVCTSKFGKYAQKIIDEFDLHQYFEFVSGGDYGIRKQDQLAQLLADGSISSESLMIGDREIDLSAAKANALAGGGVLWGYGSKQELEAEKPLILATDPGHFIDLVSPHLP
jgi:phosphoglycolate phosphatase